MRVWAERVDSWPAEIWVFHVYFPVDEDLPTRKCETQAAPIPHNLETKCSPRGKIQMWTAHASKSKARPEPASWFAPRLACGSSNLMDR
jgi:hypothetical protein